MNSTKHCGRPAGKSESRRRILEAIARLVADGQADHLTVRAICREAGVSAGTFYHFFGSKDVLLGAFLTTDLLGEMPEDLESMDPCKAQICLYRSLSDQYLSYGLPFLTGFYNPGNQALRDYMHSENGSFRPGTIMERSQELLQNAADEGKLAGDPHQLAEDLCTIFKGILFSAALEQDCSQVNRTIERVFTRFLEGSGS